MPQPEKFICISYSTIDFLIPNEDVHSALSLKDFDVENMCGAFSGIYNFDDIAVNFNVEKKDKNIRTMVMLKKDGSSQISFVTASECKVCKLDLSKFSTFSDYYTDRLWHFGILACYFENDRLQYLIDAKKLIEYVTYSAVEEI